MVVVPSATPVTTPLATVATVGSSDSQFTFLLSASDGVIKGTRVKVAPT